MLGERREVTLDAVRPEDESVILPDFPALVDGRRVWVTAVLDRTAVVEPAPGEPKVVVNRKRCVVDPADLRFRASNTRTAARRGREAARRNRAQTESVTAA